MIEWSKLFSLVTVKTFLKGKGKLSHLIGLEMSKDDPRFGAWDETDSMIMSWLWNFMLHKINDTCMFLTMAKEIWETIRQTYSEVHDAAQIYEIK